MVLSIVICIIFLSPTAIACNKNETQLQCALRSRHYIINTYSKKNKEKKKSDALLKVIFNAIKLQNIS